MAHSQGDLVLVAYGLPGETVAVEWTGRRRQVRHARVARILRPAPERVAARCPHFGQCGGCSWQHAAYARQLELKRDTVASLWERAGLRLPADTPVLGMDDPWRYRIRGEFEAVGSGPDLAFGFHRPRSHAVLPISTCPIHDERIERAVGAFRQVLIEMRVEGVQNLLLTVEPGGPGLLWRLRFHERGRVAPAGLAERVAELLPGVVLLEDALTLEFWGLRYRVGNDTFIQTNYAQMLVLYETALGVLAPGPDDEVVDLYCGIGTLSLPLARRSRRVLGVEVNPAAVRLAALAARINAVGNARFVSGTAAGALAGLRLGEYRLAIVDPPRAGCEPEAVAQLIRLGFDRLVYISCEPATHARDVAALVRGGYRVRRSAVVDLFPQTAHVETVALLER